MEGGSSLYVPTRHSHRHCFNGHVNILLCHMVIQDYMIHGHVTLWVEVTKVGDTVLLVCHQISQNHVITCSFDFTGKKQSS